MKAAIMKYLSLGYDNARQIPGCS